MEFTTTEVAKATGGDLVGNDVTVDGAGIDSRSIGRRQLFVPVTAERDGHDYIAAALDAGASAYLTSGPIDGGTAIRVDDTVTALGALGRLARSRFAPDTQVIGITGSVGKTSVKDLVAATLRTQLRTAASERSFNNELGVPLTLLNAEVDREAIVVEMGARGVGQIKALCDIAAPTVGLVTRVAAVHTELFGSIDEVAVAKGELVESLPPSGVAVLNAQDERVRAMRHRTSARSLTFGTSGDVRAESMVLDKQLRPRFRLATPAGQTEIQLAVRGAHMVDNALAAAAAALACDISLGNIAEGLASASLSPWRMDLVQADAGGVIVNDAYNANPVSMEAALRSLAALPAQRRIAVLGLMAELGPTAEEDHRAIGALADELGLELIAVGTDDYGSGRVVADLRAAAVAVGEVGPGVAVLLKASRVAGLETLVPLLKGEEQRR